MIKYIKRKQLDLEKYDACIENSIQSRVYGFSWYLDIVADNWDALVLNDYEAVMPLPWKSKLGLKYLIQPYCCQQLSVYSSKKIDANLFMKSLPVFFLYLNLNSNEKLKEKGIRKKVNYQLNLDDTYEVIYKNYRKDRKKSLKKAEKSNLTYKDFNSIDTLIALYKEVFKHVNNTDKYFKIINKIMVFCLEQKIGFVRNIFIDDTLICAGFFLKFKSRIYYLFSASDKLGKKHGATTFLIDSVIKEHTDSNYIFDFEGSSISNVASFYKSFGSEKTIYYNLKTNVFKRF